MLGSAAFVPSRSSLSNAFTGSKRPVPTVGADVGRIAQCVGRSHYTGTGDKQNDMSWADFLMKTEEEIVKCCHTTKPLNRTGAPHCFPHLAIVWSWRSVRLPSAFWSPVSGIFIWSMDLAGRSSRA